MADDTGVMSIDFLVGFTIFMLAFIWIATMIPSLLIGLNAHAVDYDAVAYRTAVILVEDPGMARSQAAGSWEIQPGKENVVRFGLARSKETPNILDRDKVEKFFSATAFNYPQDYRQRVIFGDYPYQFNISLRVQGEEHVRWIGEEIPSGYGYIRRDVKIREESNATIDENMINEREYVNEDNATWNHFSIQLNNTELLNGEIRNAAYQIDCFTDRIMINITDLDGILEQNRVKGYPDTEVNLTAITFYKREAGSSELSNWIPVKKDFQNVTYIDGSTSPVLLPSDVESNVSLVFEPGFFSTMKRDETMFINLTFGVTEAQPFLNNTLKEPFIYNYSPESVTQPQLKDAVLEVAVW